MGIKISELTDYTSVINEDYIPIVDSNNVITKKTTLENIVNLVKEQILDITYPVGSFYFTNNTANPADLFGGIWEQIKDRFLLASGSRVLGETGGEESVTLTSSNMPKHAHSLPAHAHSYTTIDATSESGQRYSLGNGGSIQFYSNGNTTRVSTSTSGTSGSSGSGTSHNNMPPYLVVNIWKRVS